MPPKQQSQRRTTQSQNEAVYALGKQGRKTGLTLEERERDEHGFENVDALFSSPEKDVNNAAANGANRQGHAESDEEQTMEIDDASQMGPATIMKQRQNRPSLPRARSPLKTHLKSPARQNPHLGPTSSPARGSIVTAPERGSPKAVNRRLDFSHGSSQSRLKAPVNGTSKVNGAKARAGKLANGHARAQDSDEDEDEEDDAILRGKRKQPQEEEYEEDDQEEEDMQVIDAGDDDMDQVEEEEEERDDSPIEPEPEPEPEEDSEEQIQEAEPTPPIKKRRGRKPKSPVVQEEEGEPSTVSAQSEGAEGEPVKKKQRGRPAKAAQAKPPPEPTKQPTKRRRSERNSGSSTVEEQAEEEQEDVAEERETKRQRSDKKEDKAASSKPPATKEKGKPGRKRKSSGIGVDQPVVQRGPPLPKGRGLVTLHREEEDTMRTTRSGRHSYRPIQFWKGEHLVYDDGSNDVFEDKKQRFVIPTVSGVIRQTESYIEPKKRRAGRPSKGGAKRGRRPSAIEEEVERDDWEFDPGRVTGECIFWRPDQESQPDDGELEVAEEELAISEAAVQLKDIKDATFRFAKTLTMPFFGSGIVDMPPGSEKRTKNSRKMQMVFFVHAGTVEVTVAQTEFRIGKGGMWFVPRGNHYSITNNSEKSARIFFAQGCEMMALPEDLEGTQE
ncbi:Mif2/CENP-C like-domain-containing protein [Annulohypoxylon bovei var. microspora]|nr:Mif2/CENP-C like-domain-containing protein [Annulohypoxylon bovei var. microspora]